MKENIQGDKYVKILDIENLVASSVIIITKGERNLTQLSSYKVGTIKQRLQWLKIKYKSADLFMLKQLNISLLE